MNEIHQKEPFGPRVLITNNSCWAKLEKCGGRHEFCLDINLHEGQLDQQRKITQQFSPHRFQ